MEADEPTGTWVRSFEEEAGTELVFRRPDYPFPPARRPRPTLRLNDDGTVVLRNAGPTDRPEVQPGASHWSRSASSLSLQSPQWSGDFAYQQDEPGRLVLRPRPPH